MTKDKRNQWHPAFYGAMHLEFKDNKADLEFTEELILNTLPLRVDLLIVKKRHPCSIQNEIGRIFGKHNLLEYKSPNDSLNYDVFLKGIAYTYLYKSNETHIDDILLEDITLSFIRERNDRNYADSLWEIVASVNEQTIQKVREDENMCRALAKIMKPEIDEAFNNGFSNGFDNGFNNGFDNGFNNGFDNGINDKGIRVFQNMIKDGMPRDLAQKYADISDQFVEKALSEI